MIATVTLGVNSNGTPILVEVKRSTDTRIARQWNRYPSVYLDEIVNSDTTISTIFEAIRDLTAPA